MITETTCYASLAELMRLDINSRERRRLIIIIWLVVLIKSYRRLDL